MRKVYSEISSRYDNFIKKYKTLPKADMPEKAEILLQDMREAGRTVSDPPYRNILSNLAHDLGRIISEHSGEFPIVRLKPPAEKIESEIEFVGRSNEIDLITSIYSPPYLLISAPAGYGKTRLVQAVRERMQSQEWFCIHIELWRQKRYSLADLVYKILREVRDEKRENSELSTPEKCGNEVSRAIIKRLNKKNILLLIDETESLEEDVVRQFLNRFVPRLNNILGRSGNPVRLILAGRFISCWKQLVSELPLHLRSLPLFDFNAVGQLVENFILKSGLRSDEPQYEKDFASHLMYFTGGHPGCMIEILKQDFIFSPTEEIVSNEDKYFETIVRPVADEIREHIPDDLRDIFDTLSVVRRFNVRLLRTFIDEKLIEWPGSEYDLENQLLQIYLVDRKGGFLYDDITRRLLSIHLRKADPDYFLRVCGKSLSFYEAELGNLKTHRPDVVAVEFLFQKLQYVCFRQDRGETEFFQGLTKMLDSLATGRDTLPVMESFTDLLSEDWEFRFYFNYLLREGRYDESPFKILEKKISYAIKELQKVS